MFARLLLAACLLSAGGCAKWKTSTFDLNRLRDPRAIDIDGRLSSPSPVRSSRDRG